MQDRAGNKEEEPSFIRARSASFEPRFEVPRMFVIWERYLPPGRGVRPEICMALMPSGKTSLLSSQVCPFFPPPTTPLSFFTLCIRGRKGKKKALLVVLREAGMCFAFNLLTSYPHKYTRPGSNYSVRGLVLEEIGENERVFGFQGPESVQQ